MSIVPRLFDWIAQGRGSRRAISKSKRRKVMATRKNFMEKGRRADPMGSNPHSYGLVFSAYMFSWGSQRAMVMRSKASAVFVSSVSRRFIALFRGIPKLTDWKSVVLVNTKRTRNLINR